MPSISIHLEVGYLLSKKINLNSYNYYLGLITPDSPNLYGFGPKEERWKTHVRRKDLKKWRESLKDFYQKEKNNYPIDFLLGYFIHILTDIIYDDYFYKQVKNNIMENHILEEYAHNTMREDMNHYYFKELEEIKSILLRENTAYKINSISEKKILLWKEKCIKDFSFNNTSKYIKKETIYLLTDIVYKEYIAMME